MAEPNAAEDLSNEAAYRRSLEVHRSLEALYPRVEQHAAFFRALMPADPTLPRPPGKTPGVRLDPVVCALAIKAATTKRAVLALCELRDGANALALTRVLLENACLLEWLIRGEGRRRLESYAMFLSVLHERVAITVARHEPRFRVAGAVAEVGSNPYHRSVWAHVFQDEKGRPTTIDRPTWEFDRAKGKGQPVFVRGLFREITDTNNSYEYDVLYGALGSDIVHSGPFGLLSIQRLMGKRDTFVLKPMPDPELCTIALATSNTAMFLVLDTLTQYLGLDLSAEMEPLKATWHADPDASTDEPS